MEIEYNFTFKGVYMIILLREKKYSSDLTMFLL